MKLKKKRASVACDSCRDSKLKCINNNDSLPCERCKRLDLQCAYTLMGSQLRCKSILHKYKGAKKKIDSSQESDNIKLNAYFPSFINSSIESVPSAAKLAANSQNLIPLQNKTQIGDNIHLKNFQIEKPPEKSTSKVQISNLIHDPTGNENVVILPSKQLILEVVNIFFDNQYHSIFSFIHKPSMLRFLKSDIFDPNTYMKDYYEKFFLESYASSLKYPDPILLIAILALTCRLHPTIGRTYGGFSENYNPQDFRPGEGKSGPSVNASRYFGWHFRNKLKEVFDCPTIQRIQALSMLSSHEWGEGNASRSYMYVGIAARMALILGLGSPKESEDGDEILDFLAQESKNRTIWSVYMMDRCNGSGRNRVSCMQIDDIAIQFPCQESDFVFGRKSYKALTYKEATLALNSRNYTHLISNSSWGFQLLLFETWRKIAKWVGEVGGRAPQIPPWENESVYYKLMSELDDWEASLPPKLKFSAFNLEAHVADNSATNYGYMHALYFLARIFLNREYFYCSPVSLPSQWWGKNAFQLLQSLDKMHLLISSLDSLNMMVIAPFTSFEVFTISTTCLYVQQFPTTLLKKYFLPELLPEGADKDVDFIKTKYQQMAKLSLKILERWKLYWKLAERWYDLTLKFKQSLQENQGILQDDEVHHQLHDYGTGKIKEVYKPNKPDEKHLKQHYNNISEIPHLERGYTPTLDFMDSLDLANIIPEWNDAILS